MSDTCDRVCRIIARYLDLPAGQIRPESSLAEIGIDSLAALELVFQFEEEFKVKVPDEMLPALDTVQAICDRLETLQRSGAA